MNEINQLDISTYFMKEYLLLPAYVYDNGCMGYISRNFTINIEIRCGFSGFYSFHTKGGRNIYGTFGSFEKMKNIVEKIFNEYPEVQPHLSQPSIFDLEDEE